MELFVKTYTNMYILWVQINASVKTFHFQSDRYIFTHHIFAQSSSVLESLLHWQTNTTKTTFKHTKTLIRL